MSESMAFLRDRHHGQTVWIVGKGPSLQGLRGEDFGEGPVIALNQAIAIVEEFDLPNPIYSLQKDGCGIVGPHESCALRDGHDWMIKPHSATLILQDVTGYSKDCLQSYNPRLYVDPVRDLGFKYQETMAVRMGIALAKRMGCKKIVMMCCDSLVNRNVETFNVYTRTAEHTSAGNHYLPARERVMRELVNIQYQLFIPHRIKEQQHG